MKPYALGQKCVIVNSPTDITLLGVVVVCAGTEIAYHECKNPVCPFNNQPMQDIEAEKPDAFGTSKGPFPIAWMLPLEDPDKAEQPEALEAAV